MRLRKLFTDDDAVSPVIGVILMVAITVILAAVIGAFVLGFGGGGPSAPSVTWDTSDDGGGTVTFEHSGGDTIQDADTVLSVTPPSSATVVTTSGSVTGEMTTGDVYEVETTSGSSVAGEYVLIWTPEDGDSSQELTTHDV